MDIESRPIVGRKSTNCRRPTPWSIQRLTCCLDRNCSLIRIINVRDLETPCIVNSLRKLRIEVQFKNYIVFLIKNSVRWFKFFVLVIIWLQNITEVKIKVVMYTTDDCIYFVSRFLNLGFSLLYSASQLFFASLLRDNTACWRRSASKTKCPVNGAIVTAEQKKNGAWVESGKERRSPNPIRPNTPPFYHSIVGIVPYIISPHFTKWMLGKW